MLFDSAEYIFLFLPVTVTLYFLLQRARSPTPARLWLVVASLFFYGYWNVAYLPLIALSILFNYHLGAALATRRAGGGALAAGVALNLGLLGYFKYADFLIANVNAATGGGVAPLGLALPLAISFFTFQQIAYLVDSRDGAAGRRGFVDYCAFVAFFPQLVAGPIVHHREIVPQLNDDAGRRVNGDNFCLGLFVFTVGLFKKLVIADSFAVWADAGFDGDTALNLADAWGASLSYTLQLYFDFSAYSDMAVGAALLFNVRLPVNFNSPYQASDIQDFWRRWHMTLSHWLRRYLYIPLGGNRHGRARTCLAVFVTMLLGGLWHGAGWTFVVWGALHGLALIVHRLWRGFGVALPAPAGWLLTMLFVTVGWVFFRAATPDDALRVLRGMTDFGSFGEPPAVLGTLYVCETFAGVLSYLVAAAGSPPAQGLDLMPEYVRFGVADFLLVFGAAAALLPNSMQMAGLLPCPGRFEFRAGAGQAVALGVAAFLALATLVGNPAPSQFLYFEF